MEGMKKFVVTGTSKVKGNESRFMKEIEAHNENFAKEKAFSLMGSEHKLKRNSITIKEVKEKK